MWRGWVPGAGSPQRGDAFVLPMEGVVLRRAHRMRRRGVAVCFGALAEGCFATDQGADSSVCVRLLGPAIGACGGGPSNFGAAASLNRALHGRVQTDLFIFLVHFLVDSELGGVSGVEAGRGNFRAWLREVERREAITTLIERRGILRLKMALGANAWLPKVRVMKSE